MKKLFLFCLGLLPAAGIFGQGMGHRDSVRRYYQYKNEAELAILNSNYPAALRAYKAAFCYKRPNARELYNTFFLAYDLDSALARHCFTEIVLHGQKKANMEYMQAVKNMKDRTLLERLYQSYDSLHARALKSPLPAFASYTDTIMANDQKVRPGPMMSEEQQLAMLHQDTLNIRDMITLIRTLGFPGYDRRGVFEKVQQGWFTGPDVCWLLMWHGKHLLPRHRDTLNGLALEAVLDGELPPEEYALIIDIQQDRPRYYNLLPKEISDSGVRFLPIPDEAEVNRERATIYLDKVADYQRKLAYERQKDCAFYFTPMFCSATNYSRVQFTAAGN